MIKEEINSSEDMISAIKEVLRRRGTLAELKSRIRAEVYNAMEDKTVKMPEQSRDIYLASQLVKDFLTYMQLDATLTVFRDEMVLDENGNSPIVREFVGKELGFNTKESDEDVPLLLLLINHLTRENKSDISESGTSNLHHQFGVYDSV